MAVMKTRMESKPVAKQTSSDQTTESFERLIEEAMKKPGVAELFAVYESWQKFDQASRVSSHFTGTQYVVSESTSSGPLLRGNG